MTSYSQSLRIDKPTPVPAIIDASLVNSHTQPFEIPTPQPFNTLACNNSDTMGFWSRNKRQSTGGRSNKTPCYEYDVFVHTPDPSLTPQQRLAHFLEKVKEGRAEIYKTKHSHIIDDRRGLYIYVTHKSRKFEDVLETVLSFLESMSRDPEVDSCGLIRRCPRPHGVID